MFKDYREQWVLDTDFSTYTCLTQTIPGELLSADEVSDVVSKKGGWFASHLIKSKFRTTKFVKMGPIFSKDNII